MSGTIDSHRIRERLNTNWKFKKGDVEDAYLVDFNDSDWEKIKLPHDWSINGPFSRKNYIPAVKVANHLEGRADSYLPKGIGWYRKIMSSGKELQNIRVSVEFEGIFRDSTLWVNGNKVGNHSSGYTGVIFDITPFIRISGNNVIAVRVDSNAMEGWWYEGSGIYRNVWLMITDKLHVANWGTYVTTPNISSDEALIEIKTELINEYDTSIDFKLKNSIVDADGQVVMELVTTEQLGTGQTNNITQQGTVKQPILWSPETPYLYSAQTEIFCDEICIDSYQTPFGIRSIEFTADNGFILNGKKLRLQGGCIHHDFGGLGTALPDKANYKTVQALKEMGSNIIRSAHNPASPALMRACDELGMLLWAEHRYLDTAENAGPDLKALIKRDRNHPSIITWGLANIAGSPDGVLTEYLKDLHTIAKAEDPTRPTAVALEGNADANKNNFANVTDIVGYNGGGMAIDDRDHQLFPERKMLISEFSSGQGARGIYFPDKPIGEVKEEIFGDARAIAMSGTYKTIYDLCLSHEKEWAHIKLRPWLAGGIMWSIIEYRGETVGWPVVTSQFGVLDICRFPKDTYYFYKQEWTTEPFVHFFPHWTWPGKEGESIDIWSYTNCDYIRLSLNGEPLPGIPGFLQYKSSRPHSHWNVVYEPGVISAEGYINDKPVVYQEYKTAGQPAAIRMETAANKILPDNEDCSFVTIKIVDDQEVFHPLAEYPIKVTVDGPGCLIGLCSGNPKSHESPKSNEIKTFNGLLLATIQNTGEPGTIKVNAASADLKDDTLEINVEN